MAGESGDALAHVKLVEVPAETVRLLHFPCKLDATPNGGDGADTRPREEEAADHRQTAQERKNYQQFQKDVELADLRQARGGIIRQQQGN